MKKTTLILTLAPMLALAQINYVDTVTPHTNTTTSTARITISGICTNAVYTVVNTNNITYGDFAPTAWAKMNTNLLWLSLNTTNAFRVLIQTTNLTVSTNWITSQMFYVSGTSVPSNTWSWFSVTNGHGIGDFWDSSSNGVMKWSFWNSPTGVVTLGHLP